MASNTFYAVVAGVGAGTGRSVALRFAKAYPVALLARRPESYNEIVEEIKKAGGQAIGVSADTSDEASVKAAFESIKKEFAGRNLAAAVFNVGAGFAVKPFLELKAEDLENSLNGNAKGLFNFAQQTLPQLLESVPDSPHPPTLIVTGATASIRGSARFATFAASKFAARGLTQSLSREFHPKGVHVAHAIIDAVIDIPRTKEWVVNDGKEDSKISPDSIAESYWYLHTQERSGFTQELDLRPYVEKF
ncbi:diacetyl reductase [Podospora aff. communis PSN243]|uniref:Diacetyl reductase n=1 Tax=Podospora aff. communis PSN243 TaxID=3040156 RepID=A0AAV9H407_9PEZI|nr:diacetyl reductase [Podospora aff. communis PSN243]